MSNFIITIGLINKNIYLPIIYMVIHMGLNIFWLTQPDDEVCRYLETFANSIGYISIFILSNIIRYRRIKNNNNKIENSNKNYFKDFAILFAIYFVYYVIGLLQAFFSGFGKESFLELYLKDGAEIIFITLVTFFLLKYKYYIHHFISITIFVILTIIIDIILDNFHRANKITAILSIFVVLVESIYYSYLKYLVEKKYYFTLHIISVLGIFDLAFNIITLTIEIIIHKVNGSYGLIFKFYFFYIKYHSWYMILRFLITFIIRGITLGILEFVILKELTPSYIIIAYTLGKIPTSIIANTGNNRWIILAISIVQIFILLFYLEILEFNFCSLNKDTKKSIIQRERYESKISEIDKSDTENKIEIKGYELVELMKSQESEESNEEEEDKDNLHLH